MHIPLKRHLSRHSSTSAGYRPGMMQMGHQANKNHTSPFKAEGAHVLSCFSRVRLFVTLWTVAHQAPLSIGFSRGECWSGLPCSPPGDLPHPGMEPTSRAPPALQADSLPVSHWESPNRLVTFPDHGEVSLCRGQPMASSSTLLTVSLSFML